LKSFSSHTTLAQLPKLIGWLMPFLQLPVALCFFDSSIHINRSMILLILSHTRTHRHTKANEQRKKHATLETKQFFNWLGMLFN
jgi:hypothetical protein